MTMLTGLKLRAIVADLVDKMAARGSWCGETHIQKSVYFLQALTGVPIAHEFVMFKHGPYSFDLHDDLVAMKANRILNAVPQDPYGPSFKLGELGESVMKRFPKTRSQYEDQIEFIAAELGNKGIVELERLATALFVSSESPEGQTADERAQRINDLKPHISLDDAKNAIQEVERMKTEAGKQQLILTS